MSAPLELSQTSLHSTHDGQLPPRMRVLFITNCEHLGSHLAEALAADQTSQVILERAVGAAAGMTRLRDELFDAVLLVHDETSIDALPVLDALRAGGLLRQPVVVIGRGAREQLEPYCFEAGADGYLCLSTTTIRSLIWNVARSIQRHVLEAENQRLSQARRHHLESERQEVAQLLTQRRHATRTPTDGEANHDVALPDSLAVHYGELLRSVVILGADNMSDELARFSQVVAKAGVSANQFMALHLSAVESTVQDVGPRGSKHVVSRGDLMAIEVLLQLCEHYRLGLLDSLRV